MVLVFETKGLVLMMLDGDGLMKLLMVKVAFFGDGEGKYGSCIGWVVMVVVMAVVLRDKGMKEGLMAVEVAEEGDDGERGVL